MTEWDAQAYNRVSALQRRLAEKSLVSVSLGGDERVLDLGCGDGKITAEIARRLPRGSVLGVDASHAMIAFAARTFPAATHPTLAFRVADAARLPFAHQFDLVVPFNCLHWVRDQAAALLYSSLRRRGRRRCRVRCGARTRRSPMADHQERRRRA